MKEEVEEEEGLFKANAVRRKRLFKANEEGRRRKDEEV